MIIAVFIIILLLLLSNYLFSSFVICKIAKERYNIPHIAYIPILREYFLFDIIEKGNLYVTYIILYILKGLLYLNIINIGVFYFSFPKLTYIIYKILTILIACIFAYIIKNMSDIFNVNNIMSILLGIFYILYAVLNNDFKLLGISIIFSIIFEFLKFIYYLLLLKNSKND